MQCRLAIWHGRRVEEAIGNLGNQTVVRLEPPLLQESVPVLPLRCVNFVSPWNDEGASRYDHFESSETMKVALDVWRGVDDETRR